MNKMECSVFEMFRPPSYTYLSPYKETIEELELRIEIEKSKLDYKEEKRLKKELKELDDFEDKELEHGTFIYWIQGQNECFIQSKKIKKILMNLHTIHNEIHKQLFKKALYIKEELKKFENITNLKLCLRWKRERKLINVIKKYNANGWRFSKWIYDEANELNIDPGIY